MMIFPCLHGVRLVCAGSIQHELSSDSHTNNKTVQDLYYHTRIIERIHITQGDRLGDCGRDDCSDRLRR